MDLPVEIESATARFVESKRRPCKGLRHAVTFMRRFLELSAGVVRVMILPDGQQPNSCRDDETAVTAQNLDTDQPRTGYKVPPKQFQFKGSGNPGGRPKKKPTLDFDRRIIEFLEAKLPNSQKMGLDLLLS